MRLKWFIPILIICAMGSVQAQQRWFDVVTFPASDTAIGFATTDTGFQYTPYETIAENFAGVTTPTFFVDMLISSFEINPYLFSDAFYADQKRPINTVLFEINTEAKIATSTGRVWYTVQVKDADRVEWLIPGKIVITSANDVLKFLSNSTGTAEAADVADGEYSGSEYAAAVQTALRLVDIGLTTCTVRYEGHKLVFDTLGQGTIGFTLSGSDGATTAGLGENKSAATVVTADAKIPSVSRATSTTGAKLGLHGYLGLDLLYTNIGTLLTLDKTPIDVRVLFTGNSGTSVRIRTPSKVTTNFLEFVK